MPAWGQRLNTCWRSKTYPPDRQSFKPGGFVWSKAPKIIYGFAVGITIRSAKGFFLAVPLPAAGKYGDGRKKVTPGGWEQVHGQRLRFVYRRGRASLLVADSARLSSRGVAVARKGKGATKRGVTIPIFVLLPQVTLKKRFDVAGAAATWGQKIPDLIAAAWEAKKR